MNIKNVLSRTDAADLAALQQGFDLRWNADMRAIKRWQEQTGRTLVWPDHADLCVWLLDRVEKAEATMQEMIAVAGKADAEIERLQAALKPFANIDARVTFQGTVPGVVIKTDDVKRAREALTPQQRGDGT